jgi:hypothetical protein
MDQIEGDSLGLDHLEAVARMTFIENSTLRFVLQVGREEILNADVLASSFVVESRHSRAEGNGRGSPDRDRSKSPTRSGSPMLGHGNAVALLFEAALEDDVDRPYLLDLAEAMYQVGEDDEDEDDLEEEEEEEEEEFEDDDHTPRSGRHEEERLQRSDPDDAAFTGSNKHKDEKREEKRQRAKLRIQREVEASSAEPVPLRALPPLRDPLLAFWVAQRGDSYNDGSRAFPSSLDRPPTQQHRAENQEPEDSGPAPSKKKKKQPSRSSTPAWSRPPTQASRIRSQSAKEADDGKDELFPGGEGGDGSQLHPSGLSIPPLALNSLHARRSLEKAQEERNFWKNRLQMLYREVDKAQVRVDQVRNKDSKFVVSAVINESVAAQLAEERRRDLALRKEKAQSIRASKAAHKAAVRQAHTQTIQNKIEAGQLMKVHQRNHQAIVESLKRQEFEQKCARRAEVQQSKAVGILKRLRENAMRQEEIRRNYSLRTQHVVEEKARCEEEAMLYLEEASKVVARIRRLREVEAEAQTTVLAQRSLNSKVATSYSPLHDPSFSAERQHHRSPGTSATSTPTKRSH